MAINAETRKPELANVTGGLSGPANKASGITSGFGRVYKSVSIPIIGMGGIMTATDAVEFFIAGASAVAIGTANFINPQASIEVVKGIHAYLQKADMRSIKELIGSLRVDFVIIT